LNYLLDTNILLIYTRKSAITRNLEAQLNLFNPAHSIYISVVTLGELESLMLQRDYGKTKIEYLHKLLKSFTVIDINIQEIIKRQAIIDAYSKGKLKDKIANFSARNIGKNDLWIAATASVYDLKLISTDNDFNHLQKMYITLEKIELEQYKD